jgi:hypothetical protein
MCLYGEAQAIFFTAAAPAPQLAPKVPLPFNAWRRRLWLRALRFAGATTPERWKPKLTIE